MVDQRPEMIIPANDTPGAKEAGVAEFIDFMVANKVWVTGRDEYQSLGEEGIRRKRLFALVAKSKNNSS